MHIFNKEQEKKRSGWLVGLDGIVIKYIYIISKKVEGEGSWEGGDEIRIFLQELYKRNVKNSVVEELE